MITLENKTALVTGASRGIGRATALALAEAGAHVLVHYGRSKQEAESVVAEIQSKGGHANAISADLGTPERIVAETPLSDQNVYLQLSVDEGQGSFSYSSDGEAFHPIGVPFLAEPGMWVGAKIGIFAGGKTDHGEFGYADFDWFRLTPLR